MNTSEIRTAFLEFFGGRHHDIIPSSTLVPRNDPTLLFTNAGMVQFKDVFLGSEHRNYKRAVSSQRCVRAGGKHNDLENVGYTARHHTFFEMLGNFSFGEYFKREAIKYAWEFLTVVLKLPPERLWVTVHVGDDEAAEIWINDVGIDHKRLSRLDEENFWQMGDTGPCGPSSEIFWDHGDSVPGAPPGEDGDDLDRYIEIWNLVFMQYDRDINGNLTPLPKPSIDTGMGLERIAAVLQGVHSNYEIDLFQELIAAIAVILECKDRSDDSLKVIADHIRACAFLVLDGVVPSNEGRGYVLRRILRRALRHGHKLGASDLFFHKLITKIVEIMGSAYPELQVRREYIERVIRMEEEQFARTLEKGMAALEIALKTLSNKVVSGDIIFQLHDTFGFPVDLTNDIARERGLELDMVGYHKLMKRQRELARDSSKFRADNTSNVSLSSRTEFLGYETLDAYTLISAIQRSGDLVDVARQGDEVAIALKATTFYAEAGGQVGDSGQIMGENSVLEIDNCFKVGDSHIHIGRVVSGEIALGDSVRSVVDQQKRHAICQNHSATHLLHASLRNLLGEHVEQRGSLVDSQRLRFDFSHLDSLSNQQLREIEISINNQIIDNVDVEIRHMSLEIARERGAMALFGEKYGDIVRVVHIGGDHSVELCGGTHVNCSGEIGLIKIVGEYGIASGIRRIEALSGIRALEWCNDNEQILDDLADNLQTGRRELISRVKSLMSENKQYLREIRSLKSKLVSVEVGSVLKQSREVAGISVLVKIIQNTDSKGLRDFADQIRSRLDRGIFVLASVEGERGLLLAGVTRNLIDSFNASDILKYIAHQADGKGGGRPDLAQGSVGDVTKLGPAMESLFDWIEATV